MAQTELPLHSWLKMSVNESSDMFLTSFKAKQSNSDLSSHGNAAMQSLHVFPMCVTVKYWLVVVFSASTCLMVHGLVVGVRKYTAIKSEPLSIRWSDPRILQFGRMTEFRIGR